MNIKNLIWGAIATAIATLLPGVPTPNPTADVIKHSIVGVAGIVSQVSTPAATPIVISQIVQAQWDKKSTPLGTITSLSLMAGATVVLKSTKKIMDSQLSNRASIKLLQEVSINTLSMSLPLVAGGLMATTIGWQNVARMHNTIILPMVIPGITLLIASKVLGQGKWCEAVLATGGGILAIIASKYHPLGVGIVLGSVYCLQKQSTTRRAIPTQDAYKWEADKLETLAIPQWVRTCIYIGSTLIGVPVSQLYSVMKHGYPEVATSAKTKAILGGVIDSIETMTSIMFYLLWGMAREGSFTDPLSKALQGTPMEWYIPAVGILLVMGTVWYLYHHVDITVPLYLNYRVEGVGHTISSLGMLFLGAHLMLIPLWLPVIGLGIGLASKYLHVDVSLLGSIMPLLGIAGGK